MISIRWLGRLSAVALGLAALAGCSRQPLSGPPELRPGRDECGECGMLINEDRSSAALLVERDGRREYVLFDDIGCLLDFERAGLEGRAIVGRYVHDYGTRRWLSTDSAAFVAADPNKLPTPMASGIAAFASRADAEAMAARTGASLYDHAGVFALRKAWDERRRGGAGTQPASERRP